MIREYEVTSHLAEQIQEDFPDFKMSVDDKIMMYFHHTPNIKERLKRLTIRYKPDHIRIPAAPVLPYVETNPDDKDYFIYKGALFIPKITVKTLGEVTDEDAIEEAERVKEDVVEGIKEIYEPIYDRIITLEEAVSLYPIADFKFFF